MTEKYKHATLFEVGNGAGEWHTLFSNDRRVSDLHSFDAKDTWPSFEKALAFAVDWTLPKGGTIFMSPVNKHGERVKGIFIKEAGETIEQARLRHRKREGSDDTDSRQKVDVLDHGSQSMRT
jgi:hypothetical protein